MKKCERLDAECPICGARPDEDCPLVDMSSELLTEAPVTAGTTGVCAIDNEECENCQ